MYVDNQLKPYVDAMQKASGLKEFDAVTSVLFAVATHMDLEQYPILVYLGARGTGKSDAMKQLLPMCKGAKLIGGNTVAAQRAALVNTRTAFVEEADDRLDTNLYTCRYSKQTGFLEVNQPSRRGGWELQKINIFGATVTHKRVPVEDIGLRSRCIVIRTEYRLSNYELTPTIGDVSSIATAIGEKVKHSLSEIGSVDRVWQTWSPLVQIASELGMTDWATEAKNIILEEAEAFETGQDYEPREAILQAIDIASRDQVTEERRDKSVRISEVVRLVRDEFALALKHNQIREEAKARGFEIGRTGGYPTIKVRKDLLDELLPE